MLSVRQTFGAICKDEAGATTIEKNVLAALASVVGVLAIIAIGASGLDVFGSVGTEVGFAAESAEASAAMGRY